MVNKLVAGGLGVLTVVSIVGGIMAVNGGEESQILCLNGGGTITVKNGKITSIELPPGGSCQFQTDIDPSETNAINALVTVSNQLTTPQTQFFTFPSGIFQTTLNTPQELVPANGLIVSNIVDPYASLQGAVPQPGSYNKLPAGQTLMFSKKPRIKEVGYVNGAPVLYFDIGGSSLGVDANSFSLVQYNPSTGVTATIAFPQVAASADMASAYQTAIDGVWEQLEQTVKVTKVNTPTPIPPLDTPTPITSSLNPIKQLTYADPQNAEIKFDRTDQTFYQQVCEAYVSGKLNLTRGGLEELLKTANKSDQTNGCDKVPYPEVQATARRLIQERGAQSRAAAEAGIISGQVIG